MSNIGYLKIQLLHSNGDVAHWFVNWGLFISVCHTHRSL